MLIRIVSAIVALAFFTALYWLWDVNGLLGAGLIVALGAVYEYSRLAFRPLESPVHLTTSFAVGASALLLTTVFAENAALFALALVTVIFLAIALISVRRNEDLLHASEVMSAGLVGFVYCGIFPALAIKTLNFSDGGIWFFALLAIVFAGDSCAYFAGRLFGKRKLLESVSPKKTIEGAIGGLVGSAVAGLVLGLFFLKQVPLLYFAITAVTTGFFAQMGDLFESLLKRLADVKDSGNIMPGHGGILDRIDGVLFAAPVFYLLARFLLF